jgi:hypothetical protein
MNNERKKKLSKEKEYKNSKQEHQQIEGKGHNRRLMVFIHSNNG